MEPDGVLDKRPDRLWQPLELADRILREEHLAHEFIVAQLGYEVE